MSNEVKIELAASEARLIAGLRKGEAAIKTYGDKALAVFKRVNDSIVSSHNRLGALAPLGVGVGFVALAKNVMEFDSALRKVGRTGGHSKEDMVALRQQILGLAREIPATKDEFAAMAQELNATGIPLKTIRDILPAVGKGAKAAGVDTALYAATVGELLDKYKVAASDLPALQDQMNAAMKFEDVRKSPEQFLQSLQGMSKTMQLMKSSGMGNVTPLMALMAQLTAFTGSSGEAAASVDALFNGIMRIAKNKDVNNQLKARGINFFNADGSVKTISELLPMIKKFGEELKKSGKSAEEGAMAVFGKPEAAKSVMILMDKYDEIMKKQETLGNSSGNMGKDYAEAQESMTAKLTRFKNQIDDFNVTHMTAALDKLKTALDFLNRHPIVAKGLMTAILGMGGLVMINKVIEAVRGIGGLFRGGKGVGGIGGIPVHVTNMGGMPGPGGVKAGAAVSATSLGIVSLPVVLPAMAYGVSRVMQAESEGLKKWRTENPYDYAMSREVMGGKPVNEINMIVNVDAMTGKVRTSTDSTSTYLDVQRGVLNVGAE